MTDPHGMAKLDPKGTIQNIAIYQTYKLWA